MKLLLLFTMLLLASVAARADINSVSVPATMIHISNSAMDLGFSGKVEYSLTPGAFDSVFVTLTISPQGGGAPLSLNEVSGDIGVINANVNTPLVPKTYAIFFQVGTPQANVNYIAHITATAVVSNMQTDIQARIAALPNKSIRANLCGNMDKFTSTSATGVPAIYMNDGPYGWNYGWEEATYHSTSFPTCINEGCTWDTALARLQGKTKAEEWRAQGRNCALGVGMNLIYHPLDGRSAEYISEDPYLSGHIAAADAKGLQDNGVIPTIKHFACNSVELQRNLGENGYCQSERTLQELFLYNWVPAVRVTWAVMAAYNKVNGVQACANKYL
jgi:beta-glucosidase-like glycosyl hydrolase